ALAAHAAMGQAAQNRAHAHGLHVQVHKLLNNLLGQFVARLNMVQTRHSLQQDTPFQTVAHVGQHHILAVDVCDQNAFGGAAVLFGNDDVLRHIDQAPGQVAGFGGSQGSVGQTLARAVATDEVLQHAQAFAEVSTDRHVDDFAGRAGHQTAHTRKLADLLELRFGRPRLGDGVDRAIRIEHAFNHLGDVLGGLVPGIDRLLVFLVVGDQTIAVLLFQLGDLGVGLRQLVLLARWHDHIADRDARAGAGGIREAEALDLVSQLGCSDAAILFKALANHLLEVLFFHGVVLKAQALRQRFIENDAAYGSLYQPAMGGDGFGRWPIVVDIDIDGPPAKPVASHG